MICDLLKDLNGDCSFTEKINESSFTETIMSSTIDTSSTSNQSDKYYYDFVSCIVSENDPLYGNIPDNEKKMYLNSLLIQICSQIDEEPDSKYHNFKLNEKVMKRSMIQYGLQSKKDYISSIYYLNEYYQKHFVIVYKNKFYETSLKDFPKIYLNYNGKSITVKNTVDNEFNVEFKGDLKTLFEETSILNDTKKDMKYIYQMKLNPISKYKLDDLKILAKECNLLVKNGSKNKTKQVLYDEINSYHLNQ